MENIELPGIALNLRLPHRAIFATIPWFEIIEKPNGNAALAIPKTLFGPGFRISRGSGQDIDLVDGAACQLSLYV